MKVINYIKFLLRILLIQSTKWNRQIIFKLNTSRFIGTDPFFNYQPFFGLLNNENLIRGKSTLLRFESISKFLESKDKTLKDIGCCTGYFCHKFVFGEDKIAIGLDFNSEFIETAKVISEKNKIDNKTFFIQMKISELTSQSLPKTDISLLLSIWHHWVFEFGLNSATKILINIWDSTRSKLFFESGEAEVQEEFELPFNKEPKEWLFEYLNKNLENSKVVILDETDAGIYEHYKIKNVKRTLFMIQRIT